MGSVFVKIRAMTEKTRVFIFCKKETKGEICTCWRLYMKPAISPGVADCCVLQAECIQEWERWASWEWERPDSMWGRRAETYIVGVFREREREREISHCKWVLHIPQQESVCDTNRERLKCTCSRAVWNSTDRLHVTSWGGCTRDKRIPIASKSVILNELKTFFFATIVQNSKSKTFSLDVMKRPNSSCDIFISDWFGEQRRNLTMITISVPHFYCKMMNQGVCPVRV